MPYRLFYLRLSAAVLLAVVAAVGYRVHGALSDTPFRWKPVGHLQVEVEGARSRAGVYQARILAPRHRVLPAASLPEIRGGGGMIALASDTDGEAPILFVLVHGPDGLRVEALPAAPAGERAERSPVPGGRWSPRAPQPCTAWQPFLIDGVGPRPTRPIALHFWGEKGPSGSLRVMPQSQTLRIQPVLRFSTADFDAAAGRRRFSLNVRTSATSPSFVVLGVVRDPGGAYGTTLFRPGSTDRKWGEFASTGSSATEFQFFVLDDDPAWRNGCRPPGADRVSGGLF
jgi:hypothetical protein